MAAVDARHVDAQHMVGAVRDPVLLANQAEQLRRCRRPDLSFVHSRCHCGECDASGKSVHSAPAVRRAVKQAAVFARSENALGKVRTLIALMRNEIAECIAACAGDVADDAENRPGSRVWRFAEPIRSVCMQPDRVNVAGWDAEREIRNWDRVPVRFRVG